MYKADGVFLNKKENFDNIEIIYNVEAVCVFKSDKINGVVYFKETSNGTEISGNVSGLNPNQKHGFHIHESGDLTDGCTSACAHYNPFNKSHGGPNLVERHVGDLGNLEGDENGNCDFFMVDTLVKLSGPYSVIGRSVIVHEDEDDLGLGGQDDSLTTGHAGKRLVCGVIGFKKGCK